MIGKEVSDVAGRMIAVVVSGGELATSDVAVTDREGRDGRVASLLETGGNECNPLSMEAHPWTSGGRCARLDRGSFCAAWVSSFLRRSFRSFSSIAIFSSTSPSKAAIAVASSTESTDSVFRSRVSLRARVPFDLLAAVSKSNAAPSLDFLIPPDSLNRLRADDAEFG